MPFFIPYIWTGEYCEQMEIIGQKLLSKLETANQTQIECQ